MRIYFSQTLGRSGDMDSQFKHFLQEEECEYRETFPVRYLKEGGEGFPEGVGETLKNGREVVREVITNYKGEQEEYVSWDYTGTRYFLDLDSIDDLDALVLALGTPVTLARRNPDEPFQEEFLDCIFGLPSVGDRLTAEIVTDIPENITDYETEEEEDWKNG